MRSVAITPFSGRARKRNTVLRFSRTLALCCAVIVSILVRHPAPVLADSHIPSLDLTPIAIFSSSGNITNVPGVPGVDGTVLLNGSFHVPLVHNVTFSYDHITNGLIYGTIGRVAIGGKFVATPLIFRDYIDTFRIDGAVAHGLNAELATS